MRRTRRVLGGGCRRRERPALSRVRGGLAWWGEIRGKIRIRKGLVDRKDGMDQVRDGRDGVCMALSHGRGVGWAQIQHGGLDEVAIPGDKLHIAEISEHRLNRSDVSTTISEPIPG